MMEATLISTCSGVPYYRVICLSHSDKAEAFAAYTQAVWDISDKFALTMGLRYAEDELIGKKTCSDTQRVIWVD